MSGVWTDKDAEAEARGLRADERYRTSLAQIAAAHPYMERWRPSACVPTGQLPRTGFWEVAQAEISAWCRERWGNPAVMVLRATEYRDDDGPQWNPAGTWSMIGACTYFATQEQAFEFKMRWRVPT